MLKPLLFAAAMITAPLAAAAQIPEGPVGHTGAVVSFTDDSVTLKEADGKIVSVALTPGWTVATEHPSSAAAIKPGDFVATANANMDAESGISTELRIFEPGYEPEHGTHPIPKPNTSMTHGKVTASTSSAAGQVLNVVYPGGARHITVPPGVTVMGYDVRDRNWVKPGVTVTAVTRRDKDNVWRAGRLLVAQK